jgi:hypothetical protein
MLNADDLFSDAQYYSVSSAVSGDGNFIWTRPLSKILKVTDGGTTQVGSVSSSGQFIGFRGDDCNEMIFRRDNFLDIRNSNTMALIRSLPVPFGIYYTYVGYDPASKYTVWEEASTHTIALLHIETGTTKTFKSYATRVINGTLFYGEYYIKIL